MWYPAFVPDGDDSVLETNQRGIVVIDDKQFSREFVGANGSSYLPWTELPPPSRSPRVQLPMSGMEATP